MEDHSARARQSKVAATMRPGVVVVLDVGKNADEVPFAADQEPVQALREREHRDGAKQAEAGA
jgi:hypothetical protein